jgi:hypothetical protein
LTADPDGPQGNFTAIGDQNPPHRLRPLHGVRHEDDTLPDYLRLVIY